MGATDFVDLAHDMDRWLALENVVINFRDKMRGIS
jgi:hypothetical protein